MNVSHLTMYICRSWPTLVNGDLKAPFSIATTPMCMGGCYFFHWVASLILDLYLIMLSVKQEGISTFFFLIYNLTCDWTLVFWTIGKHSNHYANRLGKPCGLFTFNIRQLIWKLNKNLKSYKYLLGTNWDLTDLKIKFNIHDYWKYLKFQS